jgi:hypothetical protein
MYYELRKRGTSRAAPDVCQEQDGEKVPFFRHAATDSEANAIVRTGVMVACPRERRAQGEHPPPR